MQEEWNYRQREFQLLTETDIAGDSLVDFSQCSLNLIIGEGQTDTLDVLQYSTNCIKDELYFTVFNPLLANLL